MDWAMFCQKDLALPLENIDQDWWGYVSNPHDSCVRSPPGHLNLILGKEIRFESTKILENWLTTNDIRVIILTRDPRSIWASRKPSWSFRKIPRKPSCQTTLGFLEMNLDFFVVKYENLVANPVLEIG